MNVLLRFLLRDDAVQSARANQLIRDQCTEEKPGFINAIVLAELVWVLARGLKTPKSRIIELLEMLLSARQLRLAEPEACERALDDYRSGGDFADALIGHMNQQRGASPTFTFDQTAARFPSFSLA